MIGGVGHGTLYGFRCWGPNWPHVPAWTRHNSGAGFIADVDPEGNRFNPNKVLFDPYAPELSHNLLAPEIPLTSGDEGVFGTGGPSTAACRDGSSTQARGRPRASWSPIRRRSSCDPSCLPRMP